jgi:hypothetical protein
VAAVTTDLMVVPDAPLLRRSSRVMAVLVLVTGMLLTGCGSGSGPQAVAGSTASTSTSGGPSGDPATSSTGGSAADPSGSPSGSLSGSPSGAAGTAGTGAVSRTVPTGESGRACLVSTAEAAKALGLPVTGVQAGPVTPKSPWWAESVCSYLHEQPKPVRSASVQLWVGCLPESRDYGSGYLPYPGVAGAYYYRNRPYQARLFVSKGCVVDVVLADTARPAGSAAAAKWAKATLPGLLKLVGAHWSARR